jgi:transcriptional regulator with XRE-family HTH domain
MTFSERLKELRDKNKMSQSKLAELTGLHYTQIGRYEKGKSMPSSDVLSKFAEIFSVSIDYILDGSIEEAAQSHIHDRDLLKQFKEIETFSEKDKEIVKIFLDAFITKKHIQELAR